MQYTHSLRVALITGTLGQAGAEKQFMFILHALLRAGVTVRVYTPAESGFYGSMLRAMMLPPVWFGQHRDPVRRTATLIKDLRRFRPDIVQSIHAFTNPYAAIAARAVSAVSIGGLRSDLSAFLAKHRLLGPFILKMPDALVVNSSKAQREITSDHRVNVRRVYLLRNCVEIPEPQAAISKDPGNQISAVFIGRLIASKRLDVFLHALAIARRENDSLTGLVIGDGPCADAMKRLAISLGLFPHYVTFLGSRSDVAQLLEKTSMLVLCSESEGCPNVLLEAMVAGIPAITTPVGDCPDMVVDGGTGYIVPVNDIEAVADRMTRLAASAVLRSEMGRAARESATASYGQLQFSDRLLTIYSDVLDRARKHPSSALRATVVTENKESRPPHH
jgi:glycosyltransferase involved in cell wall biosynthesis